MIEPRREIELLTPSDAEAYFERVRAFAKRLESAVAWYAIDQAAFFGNPRNTPKWRIERIVGTPYIWQARKFATFDEARLYVIEQIHIWRETYGKDRVGLTLSEDAQARGFQIGLGEGALRWTPKATHVEES